MTAQIRGNRNKAFLVFLLVQSRTVNFAKWTNADNREVHFLVESMAIRVVKFSSGGTKLKRFLPKNQHTLKDV